MNSSSCYQTTCKPDTRGYSKIATQQCCEVQGNGPYNSCPSYTKCVPCGCSPCQCNNVMNRENCVKQHFCHDCGHNEKMELQKDYRDLLVDLSKQE